MSLPLGYWLRAQPAVRCHDCLLERGGVDVAGVGLGLWRRHVESQRVKYQGLATSVQTVSVGQGFILGAGEVANLHGLTLQQRGVFVDDESGRAAVVLVNEERRLGRLGVSLVLLAGLGLVVDQRGPESMGWAVGFPTICEGGRWR